MIKMAMPETNYSAPDPVLAQSIGADAGWQLDDAGRVYDERGVYVAASLEQAARAMRELDWFVPVDAQATGVYWSNLPAEQSEWADAVRSQVR